MKKTVVAMLALVAWLLPAIAFADSYSSLWKQFDRAAAKDQPRTQLAVLQKIAGKAEAERAYGQLLKAQMKAVSVRLELSPDSLRPDVARLEAMQKRAAGRDVALASVYASVLGYSYATFPDLSADAADAAAESRAWYDKALSAPDALAKAYATGYVPFVVDGVDSRLFGDDLLHIVGFQAGRVQFLHDYYEKAGNRPASCLTALKLLQERRPASVSTLRKSKYLLSVDSLLNAYKDLTVAGEVAIERYSVMSGADDVEPKDLMSFIDYALIHWGAWPRMNVLRNAQSRLTLPSFHVSVGSGVLQPGKPCTVQLLRVCNVSELTMTVRRVNVSGDTTLDPSLDDDYAKLRARFTADEPFVLTHRYIGQPAYKVTRDSMTIGSLPVGVYVAEFTTGNAAVRPERLLLRVSGLRVVYEPLPGRKVRFAVLDAATGLPVSGAKLRIGSRLYDTAEHLRPYTLTCNADGEALVADTLAWGFRSYYAYTDSDTALPEASWRGTYINTPSNSSEDCLSLFTDRAIYRPGQTLQASAVAFTKGRDGSSVMEGAKVEFVLRDSNGKAVGKAEPVTDSYGTASASFVLPSGGLTGRYTLRASVSDGTARAYTSVSVEEYKRPSFDIAFDKLAARYQAGDTIAVSATARTFSGVAVQGAKVRYSVVRRPALWWGRIGTRDRAETVCTDSTVTDGSGRFTARVPLFLPDREDDEPRTASRFYSFDVTATVTDGGGESHDATFAIPLGDKPTALTCSLPDKVERDSLRSIRFMRTNMAGQPISGDVTFFIDDQRFTAPANTDFALPSATLSSASHLLTAYCGTDTISRHFTVFAMDDERVATQTHDWFYASAARFPSDGSPVYVQVGSSDSVQHVLYTVCSGDSVVEDGVLRLHDGEVSTRALTYKPDYGDGLRLTCAWVKEGEVYSHTVTIACPKPDNRLLTSWSTFRDRLTPGQKEEWTLHIASPDGRAAKAQAMITMYDKSLDQLVKHSWSLRADWLTYLPYTSWRTALLQSVSVYGEQAFRPLSERALDFSRFAIPFMVARAEVFRPMGAVYRSSNRAFVTGSVEESKMMDAVEAPMADSALPEGAMAKRDAAADGGSAEAGAAADAADDAAAASVAVRENLVETAFFMPALETDSKGDVKVKFTLPESVTTWRVMGIAHDRDMCYADFEGEAVAQKQLMVEPNLPRFVRPTDKGIIAARLSNTSGRNLRGTARLELLDPDTRKAVYSNKVAFSVKKDSTTALAFAFDMARVDCDGLLVCRVTAQAGGFSDGEQQYLPVLAATELVTSSVPFTQVGPGVKTVDLQPLFGGKASAGRRLTVEYTDNPAWLMVQTLPTVEGSMADDAVSLSTGYYVNAVGRSLMSLSPVIRQTVERWRMDGGDALKSRLELDSDVKQMLLSETPWVADAGRETDNMRRLASFYDSNTIDGRCAAYLSKLQKLQRFDGSFAWWPGMEGNAHVTSSVAETLARLSAMGLTDAQAATVLRRAVDWLGGVVATECAAMRKREQKGEKNVAPSELAADYMYVCALAGARQAMTLKRQADYDYLVAHLARQNASLSIGAKARAAVVMAEAGRRNDALTLVESLRQYLVSRPDLGSYYDTRRAEYSWRDYRIPTQVAAIEALQRVQPADTATVAAMQLWLLQCKRTQGWDSPLNTVGAVSAFLSGNGRTLTAADGKAAVLKVDGKQLQQPKASVGLGYVKASREDGDLRTFSAEKSTAGTSWGAVYAQCVQPVEEVQSAAAGIAVERTFYKDGRRLASLDGLKVGDRVTVRITLTADRDFDFVQVADRRAACLEPASQLSGYRDGCYVAVRDNVTCLFFDRLAKGRHSVETAYYVDRAGSYRSGSCTAQCAYSPEFAGRDRSVSIVSR